MPETDINKMKVADLKRELKLRGLATTGNKNELQDRLQTAMLDGEISLDDAAISNEDLLDEDAILTDEEDDAKILGVDEHELLSSPTTLKALHVEASSTTSTTIGAAGADDDILGSPTPGTGAASSSTMPAKKIVLKRKSISIADLNTAKPAVSSTTTTTAITGKSVEKTSTTEDATAPKALKMSERNPITVGTKAASPTPPGKAKPLTMQERLELRAKKFGIAATATPTVTATAGAAAAKAPATAKAAKAASLEIVKAAPAMSDEKQIELLKKRAERFGCVVSSKIAKIDADEKLKKRQQRFGGGAASTAAVSSSTAGGEVQEKLLKRQQRFGLTGNGTAPASAAGASDEWAEKARARLERFKGAASKTTAEPTDGVASAAVTADVVVSPPTAAAAVVVASSNGD